LTIEDKRNKVQMALEIEGFDKMSDREIARFCEVSHPFVASVRRPEVKEKQAKNVEKHFEKKADKNSGIKFQSEESSVGENTTHRESPNQNSGAGPDEQELKANEMAMEADVSAMHKLLESDDALATAHAEIKRLNLAYAQLDTRFKGLMNERNAAVKMVKELQKQIDKAKTKK
jgi:hypothetical protein